MNRKLGRLLRPGMGAYFFVMAAFCAAALLEEEMENVVQLSVPLTAEAHWGRNWLEAKG